MSVQDSKGAIVRNGTEALNRETFIGDLMESSERQGALTLHACRVLGRLHSSSRECTTLKD